METGEQVEMDLEDFVAKFKEIQPIGGNGMFGRTYFCGEVPRNMQLEKKLP